MRVLIPAVLSLIIGEFTEVCPWLARRILRTAARRLGDAEATERYEAEWIALLDERPGKVLKLIFAAWIAVRATQPLRAIHRPKMTASTDTTAKRRRRRPRLQGSVEMSFARSKRNRDEPRILQLVILLAAVGTEVARYWQEDRLMVWVLAGTIAAPLCLAFVRATVTVRRIKDSDAT